MVLGFTLAEVLLLLLFLLLLALGAQLVKLRDELEATPDQDKAELQKLRHVLATVTPILKEAEKINPDDPPEALKQGLAFVEQFGLQTQPDQLRRVTPQLAEILEKASKLNRDGPPELLLQRGLSAIEKVGPDTPLAEVQRIRPDIASALDRAMKIDSQNPAAVLHVALTKAETPPPAAVPPSSELQKGKHDWPPIISLSEADGYFFESGSTELSPAFRERLSKTVIDRLLDIIKRHDVNVIEVVGHTDEQPLSGRSSNLDKLLFPYLQGQSQDKFTPSDNAGLGLARAVAVLKLLHDDPRLANRQGLRIIPLSGAQLTTISDELATGTSQAVKKRRRIEIRVRRSDREPVPEVPDIPDPLPVIAVQTPAEPERPQVAPIDPGSTGATMPLRPVELRTQEVSRPSQAKPRDKECSQGIEQWSDRCR
jgi:outer membrane protein OmpA-like peptidoglycan-associated protein